ncbi:hypothetical protein CAL26_25775 [Bordetella genomosp. 9]|uniref:NADPH--hemoprotein reductase n=2 Tax=Bordetella genomosp. 9 TaxID=1416803 RepID=A0A261RB10_9BORD|nr:hypothetical protein CAL26_25775 [Bordetella genomosp. 9]
MTIGTAAGARAGDAVLVVHASQTGQALALASATARVLRASGLSAHAASIEHVDAKRLAAWPSVLFVASTYGEGDPPDAAADFAGKAMARAADLPGLRYAVLALGDRGYRNFCGFGHRLSAWLRAAGATPLFETVEVDRGDPAALQRWRTQLAVLQPQAMADADSHVDTGIDSGLDGSSHNRPNGRPNDRLDGAADADPFGVAAPLATWRLVQRMHVNEGSSGAPCFHLALAPQDGAADWQAGDIAEIALPGNTGTQAMRDYSIASLPADGAIHLLVRQRRDAEGRLGPGSRWLTLDAPLGSALRLRIRPNPNFHGPADDRPMILIGNGTGIAGLRAHLKARAARGHHRNWLLFGERHEAHDRPYGSDIDAWRQAGVLERLDRAYSRDLPARRLVQHALRDAADLLRAWVAAGAALYVCGSATGMARGVDETLREILGDAGLHALSRAGRYRRDVY